MKNTIMKLGFVITLMLAGIVSISSQVPTSQTANEFSIAYSLTRQGTDTTPQFNENTDSHGVNLGYTRYLNGSSVKSGTVGLTVDLGASFTGQHEALVTATGGLTVKARNNKRFQPYARGLAGAARQNVNVNNVTDFSDWSTAFIAGAGVDFNLKRFSRYKVGVGVDYLNTGFFGERQHGVRGSARFVF